MSSYCMICTCHLGTSPGNAVNTVNYPANGEMSDWVLSEYGIISLSPELGTNDYRTNTFFIQTRDSSQGAIIAKLQMG